MSSKMISSGDFDDWFSQLWQQKSSSFNFTEEIQFIILAATWRGPSHKFTAFLAGVGKKMNFVTETRPLEFRALQKTHVWPMCPVCMAGSGQLHAGGWCWWRRRAYFLLSRHSHLALFGKCVKFKDK